ncbi:MAG TPA: hypothetical protein VHL80_21385 [Polyangia bacterium]|nr:hypothetical protein [Polyangia bacterium]
MRSLALAAALALAWAGGCGSSAVCHCPAGGSVVTLRPDLQQMVSTVTTDTCFLSSSDPTQLIYLQSRRVQRPRLSQRTRRSTAAKKPSVSWVCG